jgi:hypothetical protein
MSGHYRPDCKGTGKIRSTRVRLFGSKKRPVESSVTCPGLLAEQFKTKRIPIRGDK